MPIAIALSGGGTKGSFEVGALRALYVRGVMPDIITGCSVGSINAAKLAENHVDDTALTQLEALWLGLNVDSDMYVEDPTFAQLTLGLKNLFRINYIKTAYDVISFINSPMWGWASLIFDAIPIAITGNEIYDGIKRIIDGKAKSIYRLDPIKANLSANLNPTLVQDSGITLRLALTSLESGRVRYVNEQGRFVDDNSVVPLRDAVIASASIPSIFPPVKLGSENFVDGGIRDMIPVQAAIAAGADKVYAISASRIGVDPALIFDNSTIVDIGLRAVADIMPDTILQLEVNPNGAGWPSFVNFIVPDFSVHDSLTVDPGLIRINRLFGYMRAAEIYELSNSQGNVLQMAFCAMLSTQIAQLRKLIWTNEHTIAGKQTLLQTLQPPNPLIGDGSPEMFIELRQLKLQLKNLLEDRMLLFGGTPTIGVSPLTFDFGQVPVCKSAGCIITIVNKADFGTLQDTPVSSLWLEFEAHPFTNAFAPNPWALYDCPIGIVPAEAPPAPMALPSGDLFLGLSLEAGPFSTTLPSTTIPPGGKIQIPVAYNPVLGQSASRLLIQSNDPNSPTVIVNLRGEGVALPAQPRIFPASVMFGAIFVGSSRSTVINIANSGCQPFRVTALSSDNATVTIKSPPLPFTVNPNSISLVTLTFTPMSPFPVKGTITIKANVQGANVTFTVPFTGSGRLILHKDVQNASSALPALSKSIQAAAALGISNNAILGRPINASKKAPAKRAKKKLAKAP